MVPYVRLNLCPRLSTVLTHGDGPFFADSDCPVPVSKLYLLKVVSGRAAGYRPRLPTVL